MIKVPVDVVQLIFDACVPSASFDNWSARARDLLSFSLVNKTWSRLAQDELYRYPVMQGQHEGALIAATKAGKWVRAKELRFWDVDWGKGEVKDVLRGCKNSLKHVWIAGCKGVDLERIAKAKNLVSLHLYESSLSNSPLKAIRYFSRGIFNDPIELCFPSLRDLSLLGAIHTDKLQTHHLMSLSPNNCPLLEAICLSESPMGPDQSLVSSLRASKEFTQKFVLNITRVIESFHGQLRALSIFSSAPIQFQLALHDPASNFFDSLQLLTVQGFPGSRPFVGLPQVEFYNAHTYTSRPSSSSSEGPPPRYAVQCETLHIGKRPFTNGKANACAEGSFAHDVPRKLWNQNPETTFIGDWGIGIAKGTAWEQALRAGFWKLVTEMRESPEWDA